ncbi:efflux RND transporter permease subunit [Acutalibacter sp. 1XD8-36]|uniref:efflux RND transporter permease subunit n=1 Tax=Acutalibacter sp. 1XD8-36 TaxID=2320852 RepID=UPI0026345D4B|nr:efflux RND transporter permease subunit [Acutalibacter sp. 1XD8-36]
MFSKFSVKKPMTVLVGVVIAIVLGIVAFSRMTPDLLPNINLPYAVIITAYPGAAPEEVEEEVTKPIEQAMATLDHVEEITSVSRENASQVMLQLTDDANMDTLTADIREKISSVSGGWGDMVGTPYIMKINPSMMPVTVATMEMEGMDSVELTDLLDSQLMLKLEGIEGVASVAASGNVQESITVELRQDKIDKLNDKLRAKLDEKFGDAEKELEESSKEIEDGLNETREQQEELDGQKAQLEAGQSQLAQQTGQAQGQLISKKVEIESAKAQIAAQLTTMEQNRKQLQDALDKLKALQATLSQLTGQLGMLDQGISGLQEAIAGYTALSQQLEALKAQLEALEPESEEYALVQQQIEALQPQLAAAEAALAALGTTPAGAPAKLAELQENRAAVEKGLAEAKAMAAAGGADPENLDRSIAEAQADLAKLGAGMDQLKATSSQLESGAVTVDQALRELSRQQTSGIMQMSAGMSQIIAGQSALGAAQQQLESAKAQIEGAREDFDTQKDAAYKNADLPITMEMVSQILTAQNFSMPAGYIEDQGTEILVRVGDKLEDKEELAGLLLFDTGDEGIGRIYLRDVADISVESNAGELYAKINGENGLLLSFTKQSTYSTALVSKNIGERFGALSEEYEGLKFTTLMDQGNYIYIVVDTVLQNLVLGAVLAVLILLLFLRDLRPTIVIAFSIPISLLVAIVLMYFSGVTLNVISLSGLAVGVGMLVDNSVVVIENIYRLRSEGMPAAKASVQGAVQVTGAIIASTLTTVCVFLPIVFVEGVTRELFSDMALTIGYSLLASLFVAITLVPAMTSTTLRQSKAREHSFFDRVLGGYGKIAAASLRHKWVCFTLALLLLAGSTALALSRGFIFMPAMSGSQLDVSFTMPDEEATFEETTEMADRIAERIMELDCVETVGAMAGGDGSGGSAMLGMGGSGDVSIYVILDEGSGVKDSEAARMVEEACADLECEVDAQGAMDMSAYMSAMSGSGVEVKLRGDDMDSLIDTANELTEILSEVEGADGAESDLEDSTPELRIVVDKNKAMENGLTIAQVYQSVSGDIAEDKKATSISVDGYSQDVLVVHPEKGGMNESYLKSLTVTSTDRTTGETEEVPLIRIASFEERQSLNSINRENQNRVLTVRAGIADGNNVTLVTREVQKALEGYEPPKGVTLEMAGENETIMEAMGQLMQMAAMAILIIYLIMVIQFQSLLLPFIVMFTIPLAFTGGFLGLYICGMEVSVVSMIGFIMLAGIIVNNGIVLIDYINQLRLEGVERRDAIILAGRTRMRPILMTVLTTVLGLVFMALATGMGAEMMQPIAVVCIGGLLYATLMTLFVVPAMYDIMARKELKKVEVD